MRLDRLQATWNPILVMTVKALGKWICAMKGSSPYIGRVSQNLRHMPKLVDLQKGSGESWTIQFVVVLASCPTRFYFVFVLPSGTFGRPIKIVWSGHCSMKVANANCDGSSKDLVCPKNVMFIYVWWVDQSDGLVKDLHVVVMFDWSKLARTSCMPWSLCVLGWNREAPSYKMQTFLSRYRHENARWSRRILWWNTEGNFSIFQNSLMGKCFLCWDLLWSRICCAAHYSGSAAPPAVKSASVTSFMVHLYWSAAEPMSTATFGSIRLGIFQMNGLPSVQQFNFSSFLNLNHGPIMGFPTEPQDCFQA